MTDAVRAIEGPILGAAVLVADLDGAVLSYESWGFVLSDRSYRTEWGIEVATFGFADGSYLELVTPRDRGFGIASAMARVLGRKGDALYLTCYRSDDVAAAHERLVAEGIATLGPPQQAPPSTGERARMVWLDPRAAADGVVVQLLELVDGPRRFARVTPGRRLVDVATTLAGRAGLVVEVAAGHRRPTLPRHVAPGCDIELVDAAVDGPETKEEME